MGLQIRKRKKLANGNYINYSNSGVSYSTKTGAVTTNVSSRGVRTTVNLGNGVRYVSQKGWKNRKGEHLLTSVANAMLVCSLFGFIAYYIKEWFNL